MAEDDRRSQASAATGSTGLSSSSSQRDATNILKKRYATKDGEEKDLLEQQKSIQEGVFACMYTLAREKLIHAWWYDFIKVAMEGLTGFIVGFNPTISEWNIDRSNWFWQIIRWANYKSPIALNKGYDWFVNIFYVHVAVIMAIVVAVIVLTFALRRAEQSKRLRLIARWLQFFTDVVFGILYMTIFEYITTMFSCNWDKDVIHHMIFTDKVCTESPHMIHLVVAGITAVVFFAVCASMVVASCDLNPVARGTLDSPAAVMRLKVLAFKALYIISINVLSFIPKFRSIVVVCCTFIIWWLNFVNIPFYTEWVNCIWSAMWLGISYSSGVLVYTSFNQPKDPRDPEWNKRLTMDVLYGIFPFVVAGVLIQWVWLHYKLRVAKLYINPPPDVKLKNIHKFSDPRDVGLVARVMRKFDLDGIVDEEAADLGEMVIKAGMATYVNNPDLLITYATFLMEVRRDGPASRTQLQIASKHQPTVIERYQIFATVEASKRLKDSATEGQLDLQAYVEFKRNYRAVVRLHKEVLTAQRGFWKLLMKKAVRLSAIHDALLDLEQHTERAKQVYRRVMERYPNNGKLLRCYGRFLEDVKNDMGGAARYYVEAGRAGGGGDGLMSMDFDWAGQGKPEFLTTMDAQEDAVIIIDAVGSIMMVSQGVCELFGIPRVELEGANVSTLMPQPFSGRHASYLQRYTTTNDPHILDTVREVVALHKERYVFPVELCVTKLSGVGADCMFLGLIRPLSLTSQAVRVWVSPSGSVLCCDQLFASLVGQPSEDLIGKEWTSVVTEMAAAQELFETCLVAPIDEFSDDRLAADFHVIHKWLPPVPVRAVVKMGGTDSQRIFVVNMHRTDGREEMLAVCDVHSSLVFATYDLSVLLGYPYKKLHKMKLTDLLPQPFNALHSKWLRSWPPTYGKESCRSGVVVHLKSSTGVQVPVRIQVTHSDDRDGTKHVVRINKASVQEYNDSRCVSVTIALDGKVIEVSQPDSMVFGWRASNCAGLHVSEVVDVFAEWQEKCGTYDMQLMLLALLEEEHDLPGSSWRVRVSAPPNVLAAVKSRADNALADALMGEKKNEHVTVPKAAVMLVEGEQREDEQVVKLHLWRRDMLCGSVELDSNLTIRKADHSAGLILGVPPGLLPKHPLHRYIDIPPKISWESLMKIKQKRGALKTVSTGVMSAPQKFMGNHPDGGTMRVTLQGVSFTEGLGAKTRIAATIHADVTFQGAHANLLVALGLEKAQGVHDMSEDGSGSDGRSTRDGDKDEDDDGDGGHSHGKGRRLVSGNLKAAAELAAPELEHSDHNDENLSMHGSERVADEGDKNLDDEARELIKAAKASKFVARWVSTISNQEDLEGSKGGIDEVVPIEDLRIEDTGHDDMEGHAEIMDTAQGGRARRGSVVKILSRKEMMRMASEMPDEAIADSPKRAKAPLDGIVPAGDGEESEASGTQDDATEQQSVVSAATGGGPEEMLVDSRRGRVLRRLTRLLNGPLLATPLQRLRWWTWVVLFVMVVAHVIFYVVCKIMVEKQHTQIYRVQRNALAADRAQVVAIRIMLGLYCFPLKYANVTFDKENICNNVMNMVRLMHRLVEAVSEMEEDHQAVYLGITGVSKIQNPEARQIWEQPNVPYTVYEDTNPPRRINETGPLFVVGNRYLANARMSEWVTKHASRRINESRSGHFIVDNRDTLFDGYARSMDWLMVEAWRSLDDLKITTIVLLVAEALVVQLACICFQYWIVRQEERTRLVTMLVLLGLPGPILRTMHSRPVRILDNDSDEEDGDEDDGGGVDDEPPAGVGGMGALPPGAPPPEALPAPLMHQSTDGSEALDEPMHSSGLFGKLAAMHGKASGDGSSHAMARHSGGGAGGGNSTGTRFALKTKLKHQGSLGHGALSFNGKAILPSHITTAKLMLPLGVWWAALVAIYVVSYVQLNDMQQPLSALNMALHVITRFSQIRVTAWAAVTQDTLEKTEAARAKLRGEVEMLQSEYNTLMYGGRSISQQASPFHEETPAAAFVSSQFSDMFFKNKDCLRWEQDTCLKPGHRFYEVSRSGLDAMMRRTITEMSLLTYDAPQDMVYTSPRYDYMFTVGTRDLYEGLQDAADTFVNFSINRYNSVLMIHTIMLALTVVLALVYGWLWVRPHCARVAREGGWVAGLLSHVPREMDVLAHARHVLRMHGHHDQRRTANK